MAKQYIKKFIVEGSGEFPIDMLRYDSCTPWTEPDSTRIAASFNDQHSESRMVRLRRVCDQAKWQPTFDRWVSFGWTVVAGSVTRIS